MKYEFIPGIPIKKYNPFQDPEQKPIPMINKIINIITEDGKQKRGEDTFQVSPYYMEYEHLIRLFMKEHNLSPADL